MTAFNWNTVIDSIVALEDTGALVNSGIRIVNATPDPLDECNPPILFPSDDPGVTLNSWQKISSGGTGLLRSKSDYTLHFIYLHVEFVQDLKKVTIRPVIRAQVAKMFDAITSHSTQLGVEFVKPLIGSFDFNLTSPASGRRYLGATFSIECFEYADQFQE